MALNATGVARVVVAVEFGTNFSGFAYASRDFPEVVHKFYEWDGAMEAMQTRPGFKTRTSLCYAQLPDGRLQLEEWGWPAIVAFNDDSRRRAAPRKARYFVTGFNLHPGGASSAGGQSPPNLHLGLTVGRAITDYLTSLSTFIIQQLQQIYGYQLTAMEVQWCLTVPPIWDDIAKQKMKVYAEKAGMVQGRYTSQGVRASPRNLIFCSEQEAAAVYCLCEGHIQLQQGDQYLLANIGEVTVEIVVHEKISSSSTLHGRVKVKEVVASYGTYVDINFQDFLNKTIGCFQKLTDSANRTDIRMVQEVLTKWELYKRLYNGNPGSPFVFNLHPRLADAWEKWDQNAGLEPRDTYDELELTNQDMKLIFDPVVDEVIRLINKEITPWITTIMLVGSFSSSPYLEDRIARAFSSKVRSIIKPLGVEAAICHGAVLMGFEPEAAIVSPIASKTCYPDNNWKQEKTRGLALIVSMEKGRPGGAVDRGRLETLSRACGFSRVVVLVDRKASDLCTIIRKVVKDDVLEEDECFLCSINGHGGTQDGNPYILDENKSKIMVNLDIAKPFRQTGHLRGKPKIFWINACRVHTRCDNSDSVGARGHTDAQQVTGPLPDVTELSDCLLVFSTLEGSPSCRDPVAGSDFVNQLMGTVMENKKTTDVLSMMTMVNDRVNEVEHHMKDPDMKTTTIVGQCCEIKSTLRKKLYWKEA